MHRILAPTRRWPLHRTAATRQIETQAAAGLPSHTLMQRAGDAVAKLALAVAPHAQRIWVAAGPGNNGGDGLEAACQLHQAGKEVHVTWWGSTAGRPAPADALAAHQRAQAAGVPISHELPDLQQRFDVAIDALLGIGTRRAPGDDLAAAIDRLNASPTVLAIDLPSGLDPDTGRRLGACVRADHTLSLLTLKPGLFTADGRDQSGVVWFDALGVTEYADAPEPDAWLSGAPAPMQARAHARHKGSFGDVAVIGGATGMAGAALLAARAALAAGAGRVFVDALQPDALDFLPVDVTHPELMMRSGWRQSDASVLAATTVVCGCGGGEAIHAGLPRLLSLAGRLVLDADALNAVAADSSLMTLLRARANRSLATVLTPHPLEAARLLGCDTNSVQSDRLAAARALTERTGGVVVLKGSGSVIAAPGQSPHINGTGNASLASGGTGDVLAGWLGGLWAQADAGATSSALQVAFSVASQAVADHGAAAEPLQPGSLPASELIQRLQQGMRCGPR